MEEIEEYFKPDYEYWKKLDLWTLESAIFLLISVDPDQATLLKDCAEKDNWRIPDDLSSYRDEFINYASVKINDYDKIVKLAVSSYKSRDKLLKSFHRHPEQFEPHWKPGRFLMWAIKKKINIPTELTDIINLNDLIRWGVVTVQDLEYILGKPDYNYWKSLEYWSLKEASYLLIDADPTTDLGTKRKANPLSSLVSSLATEPDPECFKFLLSANTQYRKKYEIALRALKLGHIGKNIDTEKINPRHFLKWAKNRGFKIPEPLLDYLKPDTSGDTKLPLLDKDNPFYSRELDIAISVWNDLYTDGRYNPRLSHKGQIKTLLKTIHPTLSKGQIDRIATVVNPNKAGGAPLME